MKIDLNGLVTENRNENTMDIDRVSTLEMVKKINNEDKLVAYAVEKELPNVAKAVDKIAEALSNGGRLIYCGAGTSGRLGVLDASECKPTYGASPELVQGIMAGGKNAIATAKESAEDSKELCVEDLKEISFSNKDVLVGLAASGRTPYVIGGLEYAREMGAVTVSVTCNPNSAVSKAADIAIAPIVGPEAITGSTRMKSGTAQKMVLNMLSTGAMIKLGKVYSNLMVDVRPTNEKLVERAKGIVMQASGVSREEAEKALDQCGYDVKCAIVMVSMGIDKEEAKKRLEESNGYIVKALQK